jgi:hypothetical protein
MVRAIECIDEDNVLETGGQDPTKEGERIRGTLGKNLSIEPIRLKKKPASDRIRSLKDESWTSSWMSFLYHPPFAARPPCFPAVSIMFAATAAMKQENIRSLISLLSPDIRDRFQFASFAELWRY